VAPPVLIRARRAFNSSAKVQKVAVITAIPIDPQTCPRQGIANAAPRSVARSAVARLLWIRARLIA